jgi:hypothetical protein
MQHATSSEQEQLRHSLSPKEKKDTTTMTSEPELLLTPIAEYILHSRDDSPGRRSLSASRQRVSPQMVDPVPYSLPLSEILTVNTTTATTTTAHHRLNITTRSMGLFEFDHLTNNALDILLAFLQSCICADRIRIGNDPESSTNPMYHETLRSTSSVTSCFDIDALQAQQLNKRAEMETWSEKLSRRVGHVVHSLSEFSSSVCDAACCRDSWPLLSEQQQQRDNSHHIPEQSYRFHELEIDNNTTDTPRPNNNPIRNLPSGLSVEESEPGLDSAK